MQKITLQRFSAVLLFFLLCGCSSKEYVPSQINNSCVITARVLSIDEERHEGVMVSRGRYKQRGFTEVFMRLEILGVTHLIRGSNPHSPTYEKGQIINAYAYKNMDYKGSKLIYRDDIIKAEVVAVPLGPDSYSHKLSSIDKQ